MRLTERQLRIAVREMILREGFLDKIVDFFTKDPKKAAESSGSKLGDDYRYPAIVSYCKSEDVDWDDEEATDGYFDKKNELVKKNEKYFRNFMKEIQGILGEARRR